MDKEVSDLPDVTLARPHDNLVAVRFGNPTEFGTMPRLRGLFTPGELPSNLEVSWYRKRLQLEWVIEPEARVFGLGSLPGSVERRGRKVKLYAKQTVPHSDEVESSNGSHPFWIVRERSLVWGVLINDPGLVQLDLAHTSMDRIRALVAPDCEVVMFAGATVREVVRHYFSLLKDFWVPPLWAFGYHQSRYSYESAQEVLVVASTFRELHLPCDAIYLDISYMEKFKIFTTNRRGFSTMRSLVAECNQLGIKLVPILDPGIRVEEGYEIMSSGIDRKVFCKDVRGEPYRAVVWPGLIHFPDFLSVDARAWWGGWVQRFTEEYGFPGYWLDMNEPEIFVNPSRLFPLLHHLTELNSIDFTADELFALWTELQATFDDHREHDFFFHQPSAASKPIVHSRVHSLYAVEMARATRMALGDDAVLISRGSAPGLQSFAGTWTGDNCSSWSNLQGNIAQLLSLNICGQMYCGADVGGHFGDASPELFVRWMQMGVFSPLFRNHSVKGSRRQEPWEFGAEVLGHVKRALELRMTLATYLRSEFQGAINQQEPFIKALGLVHDTDSAWEVEDQFYVGSSLMVAPMTQPGHKGRFVYLPGEGVWLLWRFSNWEHFDVEPVSSGRCYVECPLDTILLFIPPERVLPLNEVVLHTNDILGKEFRLLSNVTGEFQMDLIVSDSNVQQLKFEDLKWRAKGACAAQWLLLREGIRFKTEIVPTS